LRIGVVAFGVAIAVSNLMWLADLNAFKARLDSPHRAKHTVARIVVKRFSIALKLANAISHFTGHTERHADAIYLLFSFLAHYAVSLVEVILSIIALWVARSIALVS
jgi:hypothetical protein